MISRFPLVSANVVLCKNFLRGFPRFQDLQDWISVLGALQVAANGDLANWSTGADDAIPAVGGAMDLVAGVKRVFVMTTHVTKEGEPKLVQHCTYPLTGRGVVTRIYSDLAVIDVTERGFALVELAPGIAFDFVQERTGAPIITNHARK